MTTMNELDRLLEDWFAADAAAPAPTGLLGQVTAATTLHRPRPARLAALRGHWVSGDDHTTSARPTRRPGMAILVALLVALLAGAGLLVGSRLLTPSPSPVPSVVSDLGVFTPTGSPIEAREDHSATLLLDGRVLVVGGASSPRTAEIWDPRTDSFSLTGSLAAGRYGHTARLLEDGRVLVVGGFDGSSGSSRTLDSAEIWDPKTGEFTPATSTGDLALVAVPTIPPLTGTPIVSDRNHEEVRVLLQDGRVLLVGGRDPCDIPPGDWKCSGFTIVDLAEIFDPTTGTYSPAGRLARPWGHSATLLLDGRVLIVGGHSQDEVPYGASIFQLR